LELDGRILAMAELAWLKINLAIVHSLEDAEAFKSAGWDVIAIQEASLTEEEIKSILNKLEQSHE
jgi:porphobilinogen deaminase